MAFFPRLPRWKLPGWLPSEFSEWLESSEWLRCRRKGDIPRTNAAGDIPLFFFPPRGLNGETPRRSMGDAPLEPGIRIVIDCKMKVNNLLITSVLSKRSGNMTFLVDLPRYPP